MKESEGLLRKAWQRSRCSRATPAFSDAMITEIKAITVITVYLTIVGLVYKFKANILMHLLFFRNHT